MKTTEKKKAIAIATSDWHFWLTPPVMRSREKNWLEAMGRPLKEILQASYKFNVPILCGGDIFDHYNPAPECINYVLSLLKNKIYAVPGQHDLENHVLQNLYKTGFETLISAGLLEYNCEKIELEEMVIYFAPWGTNIPEISVSKSAKKKILLAHKYVWFDSSTRYGGDTIPDGKLSGFRQVLQNFDFCIFGDNHIPFTKRIGECLVINCGTMCRRKADEKELEVGYSVLFNDGTSEFQRFSTENDIYIELQENLDAIESSIEISGRKLIQELQCMEAGQIDFKTVVERKIEETDKTGQMDFVFKKIFNGYEDEKK